MGPRRPRSAERRAHPPATVRAQADLAQSTARFRGLRAADARDGGGASVLRRLPGGAQRRSARRPREAIGFPSPLAGAIKRRVSRVLNGLVPQGGPPRSGGPDGDGRLTFAMREVRNEPATLRTNLASGQAELIKGTPQGSELARRDGDLFVEPFRRPAHLVIVGAIHIAIPLHRLAKLMGYHVTVIDARAKFATKERFPDGDELIVGWPEGAMS